MIRTITIGILLSAIASTAPGQETTSSQNDTTPFYRMSLEELMNVNVTVASQLPMTNRESPGIITIITQEEIRKSGASDLMEVLKRVPGFDFGVDVEGVVGIGVRGNWANEGKVLLLWDGMEMNEDLYSTLQFGAHYTVNGIKRVEIIRGPGSAIYGGNAEYAVINVITENNSEYNGISASAMNSVMSKTFGSRGVSFAAGKSLGGSHLNFSTSYSNSNRSQDTYTDFTGNSYDMSEQSSLTDAKCRLDFYHHGLSVTGLYDAYALEQRDGYDAFYLRSYKTEFNAAIVSAKYEWKSGNRWTITPGLRYKFQQPWSYSKSVTDDSYTPFDTRINKKEYYLNASFNPSEKINLVSGIDYYHQLAVQKFDTVFFSNGKSTFNIDNYAAFVQSILKISQYNLILGCRYEFNPVYGASFVPRIGITKVWEKTHMKMLYSRAFRTPSVENINASPKILPEQTDVVEFETGLKINSHSYITANVFDITTSNSIVYYYDMTEEDQYKNESSTGTRGFEVEYKWKSPGWFAAVNYSYFTTVGHTPISIYQVPEQSDKILAFPSDKINLNGNVELGRNLNISPSMSFLSTRHSFIQDAGGNISSQSHHPSLYANIAINFDNVFKEGFSIQATCNNLFDERVLYIQPYSGNHQPLPGASREFQLKLSYSFSFKGAK